MRVHQKRSETKRASEMLPGSSSSLRILASHIPMTPSKTFFLCTFAMESVRENFTQNLQMKHDGPLPSGKGPSVFNGSRIPVGQLAGGAP